MPPTNGRGHIMLAVMVWRWQDCSAMQYLDRSSSPPDWIAVVPAPLERPSWIPRGAVLYALGGGETAYTWKESR